jgi:hypothetical protein
MGVPAELLGKQVRCRPPFRPISAATLTTFARFFPLDLGRVHPLVPEHGPRALQVEPVAFRLMCEAYFGVLRFRGPFRVELFDRRPRRKVVVGWLLWHELLEHGPARGPIITTRLRPL